MKTFRTEITISEDKTLTIKELPFTTGDKVEVVVRSSKRRKKCGGRYPLRGKPVWYIDPFKDVAEEDWDVLK